ncbi:MAG: DUF445 domain-containing protein [Rhodospirillales bacterium]|nr:DUF445 domain-containing protein [Rhodospirillales bacterium]
MDIAPSLPAAAADLDADRAARRTLNRHKAFATGLLLVMAVLTLASYALPPGFATAVLQAAAKAGFVGGIADWFAVTALFRHPLGLPIPHTAIIPAQKARLGRALGRFVGNHVFTAAEVRRIIGRIDLAGIVARFLADPAATRPAAEALAGMLPRLLASIEDGRARRLLARIVPRVLGGPAAGRVVAGALRKLMEGGRHQEVFGFILARLKVVLAEREDALRRAIEERVREQGGVLIGWALGASIARRVLTQVNAELSKMEDDGSELRAAFDEWMRREIARIEDDPARAAEIGRALRRVVTHETIQGWVRDVWSRLRLALEADATRPNGHTIAAFEGALGNLGTLLAADPLARGRLQQAVEGVIATLLPSAQTSVAGFIAEVVANWDAATITEKLELRVGSDLQYVRVNGTLVGFLVGGLLYALLRATFGPVAF